MKCWCVSVCVGGGRLPPPRPPFFEFYIQGRAYALHNEQQGRRRDIRSMRQWLYKSTCISSLLCMSGSVDSTRIWHITQHIFRVVHSAEVSRIQPTVIWDWKLAKTTFVMHLVWPGLPRWVLLHSGFPSHRINLSPFTKDFRGGEQSNESLRRFFKPVSGGWNHETSDEENASQTKSIRWKRRLCDGNWRYRPRSNECH